MEQEGRDGDANQNQQARRFKEMENQVAPHQPPPPQKCPRCESLNTKFCYYNNYNLGQPRYFCKGCRRYWTHGGTLRNVPVGGGCRKGRRGRVSPVSCGGESSRSQPILPPQQPPSQQQPQGDFSNIANMAALVSGIANIPASSQQSLRSISWAHPPATCSTYPGGMFAAFDGLQMPPLSGQTQGMNRSFRIGGGPGGVNAGAAGANMPLFQGFDFSAIKSQQAQSQLLQIRDQPCQTGDIGNRDKQPMYTPDENMVLPAGNMMNSWTPGDATINTSTSKSNFWTNLNRASTSSGMTESSFNSNQWPNIPDYDDAE